MPISIFACTVQVEKLTKITNRSRRGVWHHIRAHDTCTQQGSTNTAVSGLLKGQAAVVPRAAMFAAVRPTQGSGQDDGCLHRVVTECSGPCRQKGQAGKMCPTGLTSVCIIRRLGLSTEKQLFRSKRPQGRRLHDWPQFQEQRIQGTMDPQEYRPAITGCSGGGRLGSFTTGGQNLSGPVLLVVTFQITRGGVEGLCRDCHWSNHARACPARCN
jgi:hypothetical protein